MFYYIPAHDYITGKKSNTVADIAKGYEDEGDVTLFILKAEGRAKPILLTSYGEYDTDAAMVGNFEIAEHTQTRVHTGAEILNVINIKNGAVVKSVKAVDNTIKGPHWAMK